MKMNEIAFGIGALVLFLFIVVILITKNHISKICGLLLQSETRVSELEKLYSKISDLLLKSETRVNELEKLYSDPIEREKIVSKLDNQIAESEHQISDLREDYKSKKQNLDRVKQIAAIYDETVEIGDLGFYQRHFRFDDSDSYKEEIKGICEKQKEMVRSKKAVDMAGDWTVDGSRAEGRKLETRTFRMIMRAFNGECDAAISAVTWRNSETMRKRIKRSCEQINKENAVLGASISPEYLDLKISELELTIEQQEKRKEERDALAEARRAEREEKKLLEEARRAENKEAEAKSRLDKTRTEAERAVGAELRALEEKIARMTVELEEAHNRTERARSMAEQTKLGHIYVVSNEGSFGPGVFKIGMTRRLDPHDRIKELGDASVPFRFDTHALIFSEDAPALETALHFEFDHVRVNAANTRKEFFRMSLNDVETAVKRLAPTAEFYREAEAQEYQETLMLRRSKEDLKANSGDDLPDEI